MKILSPRQAQEAPGLSRTTLWRAERRGDFPRRIRLSLGRVGWSEAEVLDWLAGRPRGMTDAIPTRGVSG